MTNYIRFDDVLDNFGGDVDLLKGTVSLSLSLLPKYLGEVEKAMSSGDAKNLEIAAHTLKGSLSIYLNKPLTQMAFDLELMGREGRVKEAPPTFNNLSSQLKLFMQELEQFDKQSH